MARSLESGTILSRSLAAFLGDLPALLGLSLLVWSPRLILALVVPEAPPGGEVDTETVIGLLGTLAAAATLAQVQTAVVASRLWRGRGAEAPAIVGGGWRLAGSVLLTSIAVAVITALAFGFFLLPGWIVLAGLFVTLPVLLAEDAAPLDALQRSWKLMEGYKLPVFALVLMFSVVERCFDLLTGRFGVPPVIGALGAVLVYALQAVAATITYEDLTGHAPTLEMVEPPPDHDGGDGDDEG